MRDDIVESYLDGYLKFLRDKSNEIQISANITKLTLPFLDNLNDCTEIFIIKKDNEYIITDNGETLSNLSFNGIEINSPTRKNIFKNILISYGVILEDGALIVKTSENNLYLKKHMLLQCIIKINDMYILNRTNIQNIFLEDVRSFFDTQKVRYISNHRISGKSGLDAYFDFAIPKLDEKPMILIKVINKLDKDKVKQIIFDWNDTKDISEEEMRILVIFNDQDNQIKKENIEALTNYGLKSIPWSKKYELLPDVA